MLEYQLGQIKVVDFLLIAKFSARELFFAHPLPRYISYFNEGPHSKNIVLGNFCLELVILLVFVSCLNVFTTLDSYHIKIIFFRNQKNVS